MVLGIGNLIERKGFVDLVKAACSEGRRGNFWNVVIIGEGPMKKRILEEWNGDRFCQVFIYGRQKSLDEFWQSASVLAMPSKPDRRGLDEGLGLVGIEAIKNGVPVVAYDSGGISDFVWPNVTGSLVRPGDIMDLGRKIHLWTRIGRIKAPENWSRMFSVQLNMDYVENNLLNVFAKQNGLTRSAQ